MSRSKRATIARETVDILARGFYDNQAGTKVDLSTLMAHAKAQTAAYRPEDWDSILAQCQPLLQKQEKHDTVFEVVNETTLSAARRLLQEGFANPLCLNFASAKNPGGGFLNGSQAQEESLARASGLYPCLQTQFDIYEENRRYESCLYRDAMIYSPNVPVIRDDNDTLLDEFFCVSFLTAPAVNMGALRQKGDTAGLKQAGAVMLERTEKVLSLAALHGHEALVLGAWGCGVFQNEAADVAGYFHSHLAKKHTLHGAFRRVIFAVYTKDDTQVQAFRTFFA